ncbi:MAG: SAM-dependent methyltransferase [Actinomycetes bacterium]
MARWLTWREATEAALYGPDGFYRRPEGPAGHFRTSVHASDLFAGALGRLLVALDEALGRPPHLDVVDVGAGHGELLHALGRTAPEGVSGRLRMHGVEVASRPPGLPDGVGWSAAVPDEVTGLVVANEWLDNVPVDVVEVTADGPRVLLVDPGTGEERPGPALGSTDLGWLAAWWPVEDAAVGDRAEVGCPRDEAWARVIRALAGGLALGVDYAHTRDERVHGAYAAGTLAAYRQGRLVVPVPDGSCDITSHVALDACAAAGEQAGATGTLLTTQGAALRALGVDRRRPPVEQARTDPRAYLARLSSAGQAAELTDPVGLGRFGWLAQGVGVELARLLAGAEGR